MYQALYRKWRPQVFADVVGQPHITTTLMNQIRAGRHSHAYLFTGSRGTGKTTCAKIFAKAVNCLNPQNGDPCNECEICKGIDNGSIMDIIEIDAASNNGVDNIRDLREEVNFTPVHTKYRVYIIDEVHMLSMGAFNALLKTLEEPPEHVKFILATTEVHKLPATILSRCQRFDFNRIPSEDIAKRLCYVAQQENVTLEQDAALLIAGLSDGALRDALSILDQCTVKSKDITVETVNDVVGLAGTDYLFSLSGAIKDKNSAKALETINYLHNHSCDMERLCDELINHFRNMMIVKTVNNPKNLIVCTDDELKELTQMAKAFDMDSILYSIDVLGKALSNLRLGLNRRVEMEMTMIKLCSPMGTDNESLALRVKALEDAVNSGNFNLPNSPKASDIPSVKSDMPATMSQNEQKSTVLSKPQSVNTSVQHEDINKSKIKPVDNNVEEPEQIPFPIDIDEPPAVVEKQVNPQNKFTQAENKPLKKHTQQQPQQKQPQSQPQVQPQPQQNSQSVKDGEIEPQKWLAVIRQVINIDKGLIGSINNSSAYKKGDLLNIKSDNVLLKRFMQQEYHIKAIKQAVKTVLGQEFKIVLDDGDNVRNKQEKNKQKDPLDNLISHAKNLDFNFKIEE